MQRLFTGRFVALPPLSFFATLAEPLPQFDALLESTPLPLGLALPHALRVATALPLKLREGESAALPATMPDVYEMQAALSARRWRSPRRRPSRPGRARGRKQSSLGKGHGEELWLLLCVGNASALAHSISTATYASGRRGTQGRLRG